MIRLKKVPEHSFECTEQLKKVFHEYGTVEFAYLFGGLTELEPKPLSDIDIAVYFRETSNYSALKLDLLGKLNEVLGTDEVDLVVLNTAPISIVGRVLIHRKILYSQNEYLRHRFESLSLRKFFDFKKFEERLLRRRFYSG